MLNSFCNSWQKHKCDYGFSIYDTAIVARLRNNNNNLLFPELIGRLLRHCFVEDKMSFHSKLHSYNVLSAMTLCNTLLEVQVNNEYSSYISTLIEYIVKHINQIHEDKFELTCSDLMFNHEFFLLQKSNKLNPSDEANIAFFLKEAIQESKRRIASYASFQELLFKSPQTLFALETLPDDFINPKVLKKVVSPSGSIVDNPAATAKYYQITKDTLALDYLKNVTEQSEHGGQMVLYPANNMENIWVFNLLQEGEVSLNLFTKELIQLKNKITEKDLGATDYLPVDSDDTGLVFKVLREENIEPDVDISVLQKWFDEERQAYNVYSNSFRSKPDISVNMHVVNAFLADSNLSKEEKENHFKWTCDFLIKNASADVNKSPVLFWEDRWNMSPFYPTYKIILMLSQNYDLTVKYNFTNLLQKSMNWICSMQNTDGGFISTETYGSTKEETAYAILALKHYLKNMDKYILNSEKEIRRTIKLGTMYLQNKSVDYSPPPFWIAKSLYAPLNIIHAAIIAAMHLPIPSSSTNCNSHSEDIEFTIEEYSNF